jgi:uncharacterized zinc-type alcohol dehydrogenase-like protein
VVIDIQFCGVCHSDIHQARNEWGGSLFPMVPGHEIVGVVNFVGTSVKKFKVGDLVGVGCMVDSCETCSACNEGLEQFCEVGMVATYNGLELDKKTPTFGGYSKLITVKEKFLLKIPHHLPLAATAPLLCAGITTYSPLMHWKAGPGKKVAVIGLGGLGHMAVKIAHAMGAHVTVLSHSPHKKEDALKLGADDFYATNAQDALDKLTNQFDLILNTVSVDLDWNAYLRLLRRNGHMVVLGVPTNAPKVHAFSLIQNRRSLAGSLIGGIQETQEMLDFCGKHKITSEVEIIPMDAINQAYERMIKGDVKYRFVIDLATL